jgi:putative ABC transport system ATP-binding protein
VTTGAAVALEHVRKAFDRGRVHALQDVSFTVAPGEFVALTGVSGSGKSTILNLVGALDRPDGGSIEVDGTSLVDLDNPTAYRAETIGFVFQSHNLLPSLTASENVQIPMFGRRDRRAREQRALELLAEVGLAGRAHARPTVLSGGERQRVAIARALANEPRLLLADEPTGSLDSENGLQVVRLLDAVRQSHGMTILLVTNDDEIATHADRTLRLRDGLIHAETLPTATA